jgi:eukaryotic-like serine/threonine-protein kinase
MAIQAGQRLGPYEILSAIGAGGMGEVYRAHDGRLNRDVALKVLPQVFAADPDRMVRFEREARVLGALNHPNIAAIYGLEEFGSGRALVMELVEGETLADRVSKGPIPLDEALPIAKQMAEALEYAHDRGVVHRDLKPANIKVTADGTVKVLDFGLAKALMDEPVAADPRDSPTLSMAPTMAGAILGTAAYMSPEQAKGKPVDRRADIWAFGVVLFEMLTGKQLFNGETATEILASVLKEDTALSSLPSKTPTAVRNLLRRCLEKNLRQRLQHIGEARIVIEAVLSDTAATEPATVIHKGHQRLAWTAAFVFLLLALLTAFVHFRQTARDPRPMYSSILPPDGSSFTAVLGALSSVAVSPDGNQLAFTAITDGRQRLWIRPLGSPTARPVPGTEEATSPFWSPDSQFVAFFGGGKLHKIAISGGPAQTLCDVPGPYFSGGTWNRQGTILFGLATNLYRVSDTGQPIPVTTSDQTGRELYGYPTFLPDGRHFLFLILSPDPEKAGIYAGSLDSKDTKRLLSVRSAVRYAPPGYLLFVRERTLMAQHFDASRLQLSGDAAPIAEQVLFGGQVGGGAFSVSETGLLIYRSGAFNTQLALLDREGRQLQSVGPPGEYRNAALSPDGKRVMIDRFGIHVGERDLWLYDLSRGTASRFTFDPSVNSDAVWSPDGREIIFWSNRGGSNGLYRKLATGAGQDEKLIAASYVYYPRDWSADGKFILFEGFDAKTGWDLWLLPLFGDRKPIPFLQTEFDELEGQFSPTGRWIAYSSNETGKTEVYVRSFSASGGKWQISTNGGTQPKWRPDGKELFYLASDGNLMAVPVKAEATFEGGVPKALFPTMFGGQVGGGFEHYRVTPDGQRFLINTLPEGQRSSAPITVVLNWSAVLKK